jgi:hypothetical protein
VSLVAQTYTTIQGLSSALLAANATYALEAFINVQMVGIQGCQYGFQCVQSGAHQGNTITLGMDGSQTLGGGNANTTGVTDIRQTWGSQAGAANAHQVGNQGWMLLRGTFSTNAVAGSQFQIQAKGNQATVTMQASAGSWARYTRIV